MPVNDPSIAQALGAPPPPAGGSANPFGAPAAAGGLPMVPPGTPGFGPPPSQDPYAGNPYYRPTGAPPRPDGNSGVQTTFDAQQKAISNLGLTYSPAAGSQQYGTTVGLNSSNLGTRNDWANDTSGAKPWMSRGEAAQDTRNNYYYGGSPGGAAAFNAGLGGTMAGLGTGFNQIQGGANLLGANAFGAQQAAQGRDPMQFVDRGALVNGGIDRGSQVSAIGQLNQFANQGPGPSAAQAQLNQATNANMMNSLALARSGRGMGQSSAGMRQAIGQNAVTGQQAANQSAVLAAQEYQQYQQNKLNALGSMGTLSGQARQGDVQQGSYLSGTAQAAQNASDQTALGYGQQQLGAGQLGLAAQQANANQMLGFYGLQNNVNQANLNSGANYEQNLQNYYMQQYAGNATKGTDYTPYIAAAGAAIGSFVGPGGTAAGAALGTAAGAGINQAQNG